MKFFKDILNFLFPASIFGAGIVASQSVPKTSNTVTLKAVGEFKDWQDNARKMDNAFFRGWFQNNGYIDLVAAMVMVESTGGRNLVREVSTRDTSYGPMQVTPYTARDIYERGKYRNFPPSKTVLLTPVGGMYFGMAYVKMLREVNGFTKYSDITRAYNGGPNFKGNIARSNQTLAHWGKVNQFLV
jgi:hypothetical protein